MQNNFGLKDLIMIVLILALFVSVWVAIFQDDRRWSKTQEANAKLENLERQIVQLERQLRNRPVVAAPAPGDAQGPQAPQAPTWARADVPVTVSEPWDFTTDPYDADDFVPGGEFTEIYEVQPPKLTPFTFSDVYGRRVNDMITESLGWYHPETLKIRGRLAEAWQLDPEGMWLRVKVRDEARFSDGEPVLAEDVRWTYEDLIFNQQIEAERFRSVYSAIEDVQVIGDPETSRIVEFTFKSPRFDNFQQAMGFKVLPKHVYSEWIESPTMFNQSTGLTVGSGPFRLATVSPDAQWSPPNDIVLVRNEQYWGPRPPLDSYRMTIINDSTTRLIAYRDGRGDMMRPTSSQFVDQRANEAFLKEHDARIWYNMRGGYSFIAWQSGPRNGERLTPFADPRVRLAMTYMIDREKLRRDISKNLVRPATGPFLSSTPQANPDIEPYPYDPERGLELLAEAGWKDRDEDGRLENEEGKPFTFDFTFSNSSESTLQMATAMKADFARYGINMELNPIDWSVLVDILNRRDFDAVTFAWSASTPESDPYQIWHSDNIENQGDNFIQWSNEEADRLIEKGRQTMDFDERMKVWHQLHEVYHQEQPYTFLSEIPWMRFTTKRSGNVQEYNSGLEYFEFFTGRENLPTQQ